MRKINFALLGTILWGYILAVLLVVLAGLMWQADDWFSRIALLAGLWLPVAAAAFGTIVFVWQDTKDIKDA